MPDWVDVQPNTIYIYRNKHFFTSGDFRWSNHFFYSADWYYGERHGVMGIIPAKFIKTLAYGDDGEEKVTNKT